MKLWKWVIEPCRGPMGAFGMYAHQYLQESEWPHHINISSLPGMTLDTGTNIIRMGLPKIVLTVTNDLSELNQDQVNRLCQHEVLVMV